MWFRPINMLCFYAFLGHLKTWKVLKIELIFLTIPNKIIVTCERNGVQMAGGDWESNSKRSTALHTGSIVSISSSCEHHQHQHHGDDELHSKGLASIDTRSWVGHSKPTFRVTISSDTARSDSSQNTCSNNASNTLGYNVQEPLDNANLKYDQLWLSWPCYICSLSSPTIDHT